MTINKRFKDFRKGLKLTQVQLAEMLKVSQGTITDIERGRIGVSDKVAKATFEKFPILNQGWLYTGDGDMFNDKNRIYGTQNTVKNTGDNTGMDDYQQSKKLFKALLRARDRLNKELKMEDADLFDLKETVELFSVFQSVITDINDTYLAEYWSNLMLKGNYKTNKDFDYKAYKSNIIKSLQKIMPLSPPLKSLRLPMLRFLSDFTAVDSEKIIEDLIDTTIINDFHTESKDNKMN